MAHHPRRRRRPTTPDATIRDARWRLLQAAGCCQTAIDQLRWALKNLDKHPDAKKRLTPAWWLRDGIVSILDDSELPCIAEGLRQDGDARAVERNLRRVIRAEREVA
jgi:hypothetical protein